MIALQAFDAPRSSLGALLDRLLPALPRGARVLIKPEWCARRAPRPAENTSPAFLQALLAWLSERGARPTLAHAALPTPPDAPYTSFTDLLKLAEVDFLLEEFPHVGLVDLETEPMALRVSGGLELLLPRTLGEYDLFISLARLKTHMATVLSAGAKGLMGLIPDSENVRYHRDGLDRHVAALADVAWPGLTLIEADLGMEGEGPHHGDAVPCGFYLGGDDLLAVDCAASWLAGVDPAEVPHLVQLAALRGRALPGLPDDLRPYSRSFRRPRPYLQHTRKVRVWPGDSCATCQYAAQSVEGFLRDNPQRVGDLAAAAAMLFLRGFHIRMGHHPLAEAPAPGELSVAVGDCARPWAEAHGVPLVGGCPVRVGEVQPALIELLRRLGEPGPRAGGGS